MYFRAEPDNNADPPPPPQKKKNSQKELMGGKGGGWVEGGGGGLKGKKKDWMREKEVKSKCDLASNDLPSRHVSPASGPGGRVLTAAHLTR